MKSDFSTDASDDRWPSGWWLIPAFFLGCSIMGAAIGAGGWAFAIAASALALIAALGCVLAFLRWLLRMVL